MSSVPNREKRDCHCPRSRHQHGTRAGYITDRCRCFACRVAFANSVRSYRHGGTWREADFVPSAGTRRRLQALAVLGHSASALAPRLRMSADYVSKLRSCTNHPLMRRSTHDAVTVVYDALWVTAVTSPDGRRCATLAARAGWLPPAAWDDDSIDDPAAQPAMPDDTSDLDEFEVELLMAGERRVAKWARSAERLEAVRRLAARGMTDNEIGARLLTTGAAVLKVRERNGIPAGVPSTRAARGIRGAA